MKTMDCCCRATTALFPPSNVAVLTDDGNADILLLRDCYVSPLPEGGEKTLRLPLSQSRRFTGRSFSLCPACHTSEAERIHFSPFFCSSLFDTIAPHFPIFLAFVMQSHLPVHIIIHFRLGCRELSRCVSTCQDLILSRWTSRAHARARPTRTQAPFSLAGWMAASVDGGDEYWLSFFFFFNECVCVHFAGSFMLLCVTQLIALCFSLAFYGRQSKVGELWLMENGTFSTLQVTECNNAGWKLKGHLWWMMNLEIALVLASLASKCVLQLLVSTLWRVCLALWDTADCFRPRSKQVEGKAPLPSLLSLCKKTIKGHKGLFSTDLETFLSVIYPGVWSRGD